MKEIIEKMYNEFSNSDVSIENYRAHKNRNHKESLLNNFLENAEGDILEIGAHIGITTSILCNLGMKHKKKVYVIDPWDGRQQGNEGVYRQFISNTVNFHNLKYVRAGSETKKALDFVKDKKFSFVFFDGLHTYDGVMSDMIRYTPFTTDKSIICVDDIRGEYAFCKGIMDAVVEFEEKGIFTHVLSPINFRETYLYKK